MHFSRYIFLDRINYWF